MKRRIVAVILVLLSILLCACTKECTCTCGCADCVCSKDKSKENDTTKENVEKVEDINDIKDLEAFVGDKEYKGTLRKEGVFIGSIAEDQTTMRVSHRGGIWTMDYVEDVTEHETFWAVIADNETPDDYTDDIFVSFIFVK